MYDLSKVVVTSSPHIKNDEDTRSIMLDVIIALIPALMVSIFTFGLRALVVTAVTVIAAVIFEWIYNKILKKPTSVRDLSAVVTGILLAFNLPVVAPLWLCVVGAGFAIIFVKCLFGGIGKNYMNPALGARAFLMASWPVIMTTWVAPKTSLPLFSTPVDVVSTATPMAQLKQLVMPDAPLWDMALGQIGGCIGETSAIALIAGCLYLVYRKVITLRIPLAYIGTVAVLTFLFPRGGVSNLQWMGANLLGGGLMLGAIFMATDYATSPVTKKGQIVYGIGCGLLTVFIRYFGSYPEGVSYSILIMNAAAWMIDSYCRPKKFGYVAPEKKKEAKV